MINGITYIPIISVFLFLSNFDLLAQESEFEKWKNEQQQHYQNYKNELDLEFAQILDNLWIELDIKRSSILYESPKPELLPTFDSDLGVDEKVENISVVPKDKLRTTNIDLQAISQASTFNVPTSKISFDYYSNPIIIEYPSQLIEAFTKGNFFTGKISDKYISNFWKEISQVNHNTFITYLTDTRKKLNLDDWGYILLINEISESIFTDSINLIRLNNWFLLTQSGFDNKIGYDQSQVYNLFHSDSDIYRLEYYELDRKKYYPITYSTHNQNPGTIFTYEENHKKQINPLNFSKIEYPLAGAAQEFVTKKFDFQFGDITYQYEIDIDDRIIKQYKFYPLVNLTTFFKAPFSPFLAEQIRSNFQTITDEMSEIEAVNFLLALVQKSFKYKTDQDHFSREKFMIPDEIFYYEYSDCDDRSILFANLIQELLGLNVVGLRYSRHLAVAVNLSTNEAIGDTYKFNGKNYIVTDPTFIGAPAGKTMTRFEGEKPTIIQINY